MQQPFHKKLKACGYQKAQKPTHEIRCFGTAEQNELSKDFQPLYEGYWGSKNLRTLTFIKCPRSLTRLENPKLIYSKAKGFTRKVSFITISTISLWHSPQPPSKGKCNKGVLLSGSWDLLGIIHSCCDGEECKFPLLSGSISIPIL